MSHMSHLFSPINVGSIALKHRVVMAPLTRSRSELPEGVPGPLMVDYYSQRASDGGLIISEAAPISKSARGWYGAPGIFSDRQATGWRSITSAVHAKNGIIFAQLWHTGRASHVSVTEGTAPVSASVNPSYWENPSILTSTPSGWIQPSPHRSLKAIEIGDIVDDYRKAAILAKKAGFDGVELHGANGYLIDQFLQNGSNHRADCYGGSVENRARFLLEVVDAVISIWGAGRVGVRLGPDNKANGMFDSEPYAIFDYVAAQLNGFPLAYLHLIEPRIKGSSLLAQGQAPIAAQHFRQIYRGLIIAVGGFEPDSAEAVLTRADADLVAFGRHFISNPDLPDRIRHGYPLSPYDRESFYTFDAQGYNDYLPYNPRVVPSSAAG
jgi:N-ethylmaleimide reductase